ncbi:Uncharacterized protein YfbK [Geodia barretti]|uniref:Uncharacterized protein YfbK n=1 Tax=Geodia barretti TaxID=519541 RepID=A0AA35TI89_GEOBA|nr:Uncharacterized protein YfbK [Geodia barretti]
MDVDTASYAVARRFVLDGNRPDPDSVRVEEFVNYFDQEYPQPRRDAFGIHVDGARSPFTHDTWIARVGIQGRDVPDHQRKDATLVFVIDPSGSMERENRLGLVQRALRLLVRELRPTDQIGIVTYGSRGHAILNPTEARHDDYIIEVIDGLRPGGSTNAEEGLRSVTRWPTAGSTPGVSRESSLLSDGVANVGQTGPDAILQRVRRYVNEGVNLSTVGVGMGNYNDVLLEQLANDGNGNYIYIDNLSEAWKSFVDNLTSTLQVIAKDAKIQENRLELVKRALRLLVRELRPTDQIGIVTYGNRGHAILNPTEAKHDDYILEVIDGLYPGGSTNAEEGLRLGYEMADRWLNPERITRIILLSDGVANVGQTGPEAILNQVRKYVNEGVTLSTVGVGMGNYNDVLMEQLANDGDGNYFYIDNLTEAWKSFVDNLTSTLQVIARDAKIQVSSTRMSSTATV